MKPENALLIQTAFIGDLILTTPMFVAFKRHFPQTRLTVMLRPEGEALLSEHPAVDDILVIHKKRKHRGPYGMWRILREIRLRKFDLLLAPHRSARTALLALCSAIPRRYGYSEAPLAWLAYHHRLRRDMSQPEIDRLLEFLREAMQIQSPNFRRQPSIEVGPKAALQARELLHNLNAYQPIVIAPSSVWPTKRWPAWNFAILIGKLVRNYRRKVVLVGAPEDQEVSLQVMRFVKMFEPDWVQTEVYDICAKLSLPALYALLRQSFLLVSNDSAPVHLACAAGIPIVAIFGPTVPELGYAPFTPRSAVAQKELGCRPCGLHGHKKCPQGHFRCMKELSPLAVLDKVREAMSG